MTSKARDTADIVDDVSVELASKLPYSFGTATPSTTDSGFLWYDSNSTPAAPKFWDGAAFQALTSGKILQVVRATDGTDRTHSAGSVTDANISVTITPQKSDSAVLLIWIVRATRTTSGILGVLKITDNSNNVISGAEEAGFNVTAASLQVMQTVVAYATPATTSAVTYKGRFGLNIGTGSITLVNSNNTGQLYALEIGA